MRRQNEDTDDPWPRHESSRCFTPSKTQNQLFHMTLTRCEVCRLTSSAVTGDS